MHHIAGRKRRQDALRILGRRVLPGGLLVVTYWRVASQARFRDRFVEPEDELEPGDALLRWDDTGMRYVHQIQPDEFEEHLALDDFTVEDRFLSDGATGDLNEYVLWRKDS